MMIKTLTLLILSAASPAQQFDLTCTFDHPQKGFPTGEHYRLDLAAGQWCLGPCTELKRFHAVTPTKLVLENEEPKYRGDSEHRHEVDRVTGALYRYDRYEMPGLGGGTFITEGRCEPAPFSGFPESKTKF